MRHHRPRRPQASAVTPVRMGCRRPISPGVPLVAGPLLNRRAWLDKFTHVKAMSVIPGQLGSELVAELPDPPPGRGSVLVEGLLVGICGTDAEILRGGGQPPAGGPRLVIGHESLGRVLEAPADAPVRPGDLVAGLVRRPDPVPCPACASGRHPGPVPGCRARVHRRR